MSEPKLYGMQRGDQTIIQNALVIANDIGYMSGVAVEAGEPVKVVEIVAVSADRLRALESLVRAADRMREKVAIVDSAVTFNSSRDYDTQRAAVGEIEEE